MRGAGRARGKLREGVERETRKLQTPWDSSSLKGDFVFNTAGTRGGAAVAAVPASGPSADVTLQIEREFWVSVRESNRAEDIRAYLDKYPNLNCDLSADSGHTALSRDLNFTRKFLIDYQDRVFFGRDMFSNQLYDLLVSLNLPSSVLAKILAGNALRLVPV